MEIDINKFIWEKEEIDKFNKQIEYFKSFRSKEINNENFFEAYKTFYLLCDRIPLISTEVNVPYLLRGRPNYNEEIFNEEWQISYNTKNMDRIQLGRFNRPNSPMFYCSASDELDFEHFGLVASMEACKEIFSPSSPINKQYITFGKWFLNQNFEVVNLCNDEKFLNANPNFKSNTQRHENKIRETFQAESAEFIIEFWKFMSQLAANKYEHSGDHFITTAFICAIMTYMKTEMNREVNGVIYPSAMTENKGINICLTPDAVNKYLTLKNAFMIKFTRNQKVFNSFEVEQCTDEANVVNHKFDFIKRNNF